MAAEWICDGCGRRAKAEYWLGDRSFHKPRNWFERADEDGIQSACSRPCIDRIAKSSGKTGVVLPL